MPRKKKINREKNFILPTIGLILIVGIIGLYLLFYGDTNNSNEKVADQQTKLQATITPSPSEKIAYPTTYISSEFKTYTNGEYGYSFKYPSNFTLTEKRNDGTMTLTDGSKRPHTGIEYFLSSGQMIDGEKDYWGFGVYIFPANGQTIPQIYNGLKVNSVGDTQGANEAAELPEASSVIVFKYNDKIISITPLQYGNPPTDLNINRQLGNIVSSFHFGE